MASAELPAANPLYEKQSKIYPHEAKGTFSRLRRIAMFTLLGLFYGIAWLRWDGRQAVLFDLPARQFHIFGLTLWPQDFIYLALLLLILALTLFFVTSLAGRLWCGYACPQTVWTEAFFMMERWAEGARNKRIKLDRGPMTREKLLRKCAKHGMWLAFAAWTGFTFVGYFTPIRPLAGDIVSMSVHPWAAFWMLFYGLATWGNAGFLREQVCKYMCPYARFQSAMFDQDTLIIAYDESRGEPRGGGNRKSRGQRQLGDCVDCTLCVQACPTGIDIRDGLQYECIACAACIDVCNDVMSKMDYAPNLIRYTTENADQGKRSRVLRPRTVLYFSLLCVLAAGMLISLASRVPLRMEVIRDRNALYRPVADALIENVYTLRVINMSPQAQTYVLRASGASEVQVQAPQLEVPAAQARAFAIQLRGDPADGAGFAPITLSLSAVDEPNIMVEKTTNFYYPTEQPQ